MLLEHGGKAYTLERGSDVARDGMFLWLSEAGSIEILMEVFYSDVDGSFTMAGFGGFAPLEIVERLIAEARNCLPPQES